MLGRELTRKTRVLICFYPTRGMDVPSAMSARQVILQRRAAGAAILLVSEDLDELFAISDRLAVMHAGRVVGVFKPAETNPDAVGLMMTGAAKGDHGHP